MEGIHDMSTQAWRATVAYAATITEITDDQADALTKLPGFGIVHTDGRLARLSMTVEASTVRKATDEALRAAQAAYADAFDSVGQVVGVEVLREDEHVRQLAHPPAAELVSAAEAGELLGVSRQRLHELSETPGFPEPVARLKMGKIWTRRSIEEYDKRWLRKVGRPAKAA